MRVLNVVVVAAILAACAKGKTKSDNKEESDSGTDTGTEAGEELGALNLEGAVGLGMQNTAGSELALLDGTQNNLHRINADGTVSAAFAEAMPWSVKKLLVAPNGRVYLLFNAPAGTEDEGEGGAIGDGDQGGTTGSGDEGGGTAPTPGEGGSAGPSGEDPQGGGDGDSSCLRLADDFSTDGGTDDSGSAACLTGDDTTTPFSHLASADKDNGKLTWVDNGITHLFGVGENSHPMIQFDSEGGIYYAGKITRDGVTKTRLSRSVNGAVTDILSVETTEGIRDFIVADSNTFYVLRAYPKTPENLNAITANERCVSAT